MEQNAKWLAETKALRPLPNTSFPCDKYIESKVNSYSMVSFDTNKYSVPTKFVGETATIRASIDEIEIYIKNTSIAKHPRLHSRNGEHIILDHYLDLLLQKSRAIGNTKAYRPSMYPQVYEEFRRCIQSRDRNGNREFVKILMLHREYSAEQIKDALELAMAYRVFNYDGVLNILLQFNSKCHNIIPLKPEMMGNIPEVKVLPPELSKYNKLMNGGDRNEQ